MHELRAERDRGGSGDAEVVKPSKSQEKLIDARLNLVEVLREELRLKGWQLQNCYDEPAQYFDEGVSVEVSGGCEFASKGMASSLPFHLREIDA